MSVSESIPGDEFPPDCSFDIAKIVGYSGLLWHKLGYVRAAARIYMQLVRWERPPWQSASALCIGVLVCLYPHVVVGIFAVVPALLVAKEALVARAYRKNKWSTLPKITHRDFIPQAKLNTVTGILDDSESLTELMRVYRRRLRAAQGALSAACDALDSAWSACVKPTVASAARATACIMCVMILTLSLPLTWLAALVWTHQFVRWTRPYVAVSHTFGSILGSRVKIYKQSATAVSSVQTKATGAGAPVVQVTAAVQRPSTVTVDAVGSKASTPTVNATVDPPPIEVPVVSKRPIRAKIEEIRSELRRRQTQNAGNCASCHSSFGILNKRQCCSYCGVAYCSTCCASLVTRAMLGATSPAAFEETVNVCDACYETITGHKIDQGR
eukprot:Opistho-2@45500